MFFGEYDWFTMLLSTIRQFDEAIQITISHAWRLRLSPRIQTALIWPLICGAVAQSAG